MRQTCKWKQPGILRLFTHRHDRIKTVHLAETKCPGQLFDVFERTTGRSTTKKRDRVPAISGGIWRPTVRQPANFPPAWESSAVLLLACVALFRGYEDPSDLPEPNDSSDLNVEDSRLVYESEEVDPEGAEEEPEEADDQPDESGDSAEWPPTSRPDCSPKRVVKVDVCPSPADRPLKPPKVCSGNASAYLAAVRSAQADRLAQWGRIDAPAEFKWLSLTGVYDPAFINLKQIFRFFSDGERKFFTDFVDRRAACNVFTLGVGGDFSGETALFNRYPQCKFTAVDPEERSNRELVERVPNARFVQSTVGAEGGTYFAQIRDANGKYGGQTIAHEGIVEFFERHNGRELVDLLLMDIEGAEFGVLQKMIDEKDRLPTVCQINLELHGNGRVFGTELNEALRVVHSFLADGTFSVLNAESIRRLLRLYLVNTKYEECVRKFFC
ncbi:Methyltransf-21 domain-containing protein [Aphelenchoides fujianensis]|nr:Methyltransf-21 domain-containing protein [Aphelenchoides fujianensis]